jgi:cation:H+ antiporter
VPASNEKRRSLIYLQLVAGFIYLLGGGDLLVRGAVGLARRTGVPPVVVALTVVGLGTSLPELVVSVGASLSGHPSLALGNVVGSNIVNVLVVGGAAAVVFPVRTRDPGIRRSASGMLAISVLFTGLCFWGHQITRLDAASLLGVLAIVAGLTVRGAIQLYQATDVRTPIEWVLGLPSQLPTIGFFVVIGLVVLPLGAELLVEAAVEIARRHDVSEAAIGLSVVAVGTSLPEMATTIVAGLRRKTGMVVGTIVGSNIFNIVAIMGAAGVVSAKPIAVSGRFLSLDLPVMLAAATTLAAYTWMRRPIRRATGIALVVAYVAYLAALFLVP